MVGSAKGPVYSLSLMTTGDAVTTTCSRRDDAIADRCLSPNRGMTKNLILFPDIVEYCLNLDQHFGLVILTQ